MTRVFNDGSCGIVAVSGETVADWQEPNKTGVIYYLDEARRVRGAMMCNVWDKVDAARTLIRRAQPMRVEDLRNAIR